MDHRDTHGVGKVTFELDDLERVPATTQSVLVRVSGRWWSARERHLPAPDLLVGEGRTARRLTPLPGADPSVTAGPNGPEWRAAYAAPVELLSGEAPLKLSLGDDLSVAFDDESREAGPEAGPEVGDRERFRAMERRYAASRDEVAALTERSERSTARLAELERELAATRRERKRDESRKLALEDQLRSSQGAAELLEEELGASGELVESLRGELEQVRVRAQTREETAERLRGELAQAEKAYGQTRGELEEAQRLLEQAENAVKTVAERAAWGDRRADELARDLEQARERGSALERAVTSAYERSARVDRDLEESRARAATAELDASAAVERARAAAQRAEAAESEARQALRTAQDNSAAFRLEQARSVAAIEARQAAETRASEAERARDEAERGARGRATELAAERDRLQAQLRDSESHRSGAEAELVELRDVVARMEGRLATATREAEDRIRQLGAFADEIGGRAAALESEATDADRRAEDLSREIATRAERFEAELEGERRERARDRSALDDVWRRVRDVEPRLLAAARRADDSHRAIERTAGELETRAAALEQGAASARTSAQTLQRNLDRAVDRVIELDRQSAGALERAAASDEAAAAAQERAAELATAMQEAEDRIRQLGAFADEIGGRAAALETQAADADKQANELSQDLTEALALHEVARAEADRVRGRLERERAAHAEAVARAERLEAELEGQRQERALDRAALDELWRRVQDVEPRLLAAAQQSDESHRAINQVAGELETRAAALEQGAASARASAQTLQRNLDRTVDRVIGAVVERERTPARLAARMLAAGWARVTRAPLHAALPIAVGGLWALAITGVRLRGMNDLGLVSVLPKSVFLLLFVLTASFAISLARRPLRPVVPLVHVVILIVMLYGITTFLEADPRFGAAWRHVGVIDYIAHKGSVNPNIDAYFSWPGFFGLGLLITHAAGFNSALAIAGWGPLVFNLLFLAPLVAVFRWASDDSRITWLGVWTFYSVNWVAQDYFSPQAVGYLLWLTILAVLLVWFVPRPAPLQGAISLRGLRQWMLRPWAGASSAHATLPEGHSRYQRAALVLLVVAVYAAIVTGHQLTPFPALLTVTGLVVLAGLETRRLPVLMLVLLGAWISYMTTRYLAGNIETLVRPLGSVGKNVNQNVSSRVAGSADHELIAQLRLFASAGIWMLAIAGFARRLRARRFDLALAVVGVAPLLLPVLQPYGGEMLLRVYLFALPAVAFFIACLAFPSPSAGRAWPTTAAAVVAGCALLVLFQYTRHGNERLDYYTKGDVAAVHSLYRIAPRGTALVAGTPNIPWRYRDYTSHDYSFVTDLSSWRAAHPDPARLASDLEAKFKRRGAYVIFTRSTNVIAGLLYGKPGVQERLVRVLQDSPGAAQVYRRRDGEIFYIRPTT